MGLESDQKVIGYSHNIDATIVPVFFCRQVALEGCRFCSRMILKITFFFSGGKYGEYIQAL